MYSTTLVAFLFDCPVAARTVELLGSWDNFTRPYSLKRDSRRSPDTWSGCFSFRDIICDGDLSDTSNKRDGALKLGGTYWYYYRINDDEEQHNILEPSTTVCPLLPGQRVNVLEVPMESSCRSGPTSQDRSVFTQNPNDRYLTPVPPKPLPSPRLGDLCKESYRVPTPRSATYPPLSRSGNPREGHARSASSSPSFGSNAVFIEFKVLKEKLSAGRGKSPPRNFKDLEISAPTLISTTAEDVELVPLPSPKDRQLSSPLTPPLTARMREFSPLGSHPVDVARDCLVGVDLPQELGPHTDPPVVPLPVFETRPARTRANSADTRRTRHYHVFPNEPWINSPTFPPQAAVKVDSAPVLERPTSSLEPPATTNERPVSRNGGDHSGTLRKSPLDKELPPLPRFLVPAPLFACNDTSSSLRLVEPGLEDDRHSDESEDHQKTPEAVDRSSQASTFSAASTTFSSLRSEGETTHSPTMTSLTSASSEAGSPMRLSGHFTHGEQIYKYAEDQDLEVDGKDEGIDDPFADDVGDSVQSPLLRLPIPSFGPELFQLTLQRPRSMSNRQTACYGVSGFQGYSLPEDETTSQITITKPTAAPAEPTIAHERMSSISQLNKLMDEFGFLGEAVL